MPQGVVKCWVEINPINQNPKPILRDITPRPPVELEIRICVFNATDVKFIGRGDCADVYFRGFMDSKEDV